MGESGMDMLLTSNEIDSFKTLYGKFFESKIYAVVEFVKSERFNPKSEVLTIIIAFSEPSFFSE